MMLSRHIVQWTRHVGSRLSRCCAQDMLMMRCSSQRNNSLFLTVQNKDNKIGKYGQKALSNHSVNDCHSNEKENDNLQTSSEKPIAEYTEKDVGNELSPSDWISSDINQTVCSVDVSHTQTDVTVEQEQMTSGELDIGEPHPVTRTALKPSFNLAAYVNRSETLSELLKLGVDLSEVEKKPGAADILVQLKYEDVKPYLHFLHDCGVADEKIGYILTKNPFLFKETIEDLQIRINYMQSKKFNAEIITSIIERSPLFLMMRVEQLDTKLGFYQFLFKLKGSEIRTVIGKLPKLITWDKHKMKSTQFYIREFLGFSEVDMKQIFLVCPKVYLTDKHHLGKKFDFLYNVMKIPHSQLVEWPNVFRCRLFILKQRHQYLMSIQRAQYDPTKEHFISLKALVSKTDQEWCKKVTRTSVNQYNIFLKTL